MSYLILHKVRGEPALDVAIKMQVGNDFWWIIPTSGHRAYPGYWWNLEDLRDVSDINANGWHDCPNDFLDKALPADLPDHYQTLNSTSKPPTRKGEVFDLDDLL